MTKKKAKRIPPSFSFSVGGGYWEMDTFLLCWISSSQNWPVIRFWIKTFQSFLYICIYLSASRFFSKWTPFLTSYLIQSFWEKNLRRTLIVLNKVFWKQHIFWIARYRMTSDVDLTLLGSHLDVLEIFISNIRLAGLLVWVRSEHSHANLFFL